MKDIRVPYLRYLPSQQRSQMKLDAPRCGVHASTRFTSTCHFSLYKNYQSNHNRSAHMPTHAGCHRVPRLLSSALWITIKLPGRNAESIARKRCYSGGLA